MVAPRSATVFEGLPAFGPIRRDAMTSTKFHQAPDSTGGLELTAYGIDDVTSGGSHRVALWPAGASGIGTVHLCAGALLPLGQGAAMRSLVGMTAPG